MAFEHDIQTEAEFTAFGFQPVGTHATAVSSVGNGTTEPLFIVHSENASGPTPTPSWQSGNRAGAGQLLEAGFPAEIYVKMDFRIDESVPVTLGFRRGIWSIGLNGANNGCVMQNIYQNGESDDGGEKNRQSPLKCEPSNSRPIFFQAVLLTTRLRMQMFRSLWMVSR